MATDDNLCVLTGHQCARAEPEIRAALTTAWRFESWHADETAEKLEHALSNAAAVVTGGDALGAPLLAALRSAARLRLIQIPFSGYEWLKPEAVPKGATVCNVYGHQPGIAEFVLAGLLAFETGICGHDRAFRQQGWPPRTTMVDRPAHHEIGGKTLGIIGYGQIGRELARRAAGLDLKIIATARRPRATEPPLAFLGTAADTNAILRASDYVVLACELNHETRHLIDARRLNLMKPSALLVNVARGPVADEEALYLALKERRLRGAVLDVWWNYPKPSSDQATQPSRFPYGDLDNVIMSPHRAGLSHEGERRRWPMIASNLDRLALGEPLVNVVRLSR